MGSLLRCTGTTSTGDRCRERRVEWLRMYETAKGLEPRCQRHAPWSGGQASVSASALREWLCGGAGG